LGCFQDLAAQLGHKVSVTSHTYVDLIAAGEMLTGGANRQTLSFGITIPSGGPFDAYVSHD
jgi:hypothetical protein